MDPFFIHFYRLFCGVQFLTTTSQSGWRHIGIKHTAWLLLKRTWKGMLFWNIIKFSISICIKEQSQNPLFMKLKNMALRKILRKRLKAENMLSQTFCQQDYYNDMKGMFHFGWLPASWILLGSVELIEQRWCVSAGDRGVDSSLEEFGLFYCLSPGGLALSCPEQPSHPPAEPYVAPQSTPVPAASSPLNPSSAEMYDSLDI